MKRLYLIVLGLWLLAACAFGQNGPTPPVYIDTDQIVDGAVTAIKTDGSLMLADGSNAVDPVELKNASFTGDIDVTGDVGATTVNGVAPLTAAEKTQALVGSSTASFDCASIHFTTKESADYGHSIHSAYLGVIPAAGSKTMRFTRPSAQDRSYLVSVKIQSRFVSIVAKSTTMGFLWESDGSISQLASSSVNLGAAGTVDITATNSGTTELHIVVTNSGSTQMTTTSVSVEIVGRDANYFVYEGLL